MARLGASDRVTINGQGGEVMWQPVEHPIVRKIMIVDLHLKREVRGEISFFDESF